MPAAHSLFCDRDMFDQCTPHFHSADQGEKGLVYLGFDPTADSLHLGNYQGVRALRMLQSIGWTPVVLIGGATGMIGDPSGKSQERPIFEREQLIQNIAKLSAQLRYLLKPKKGWPDPLFVNNADWLDQLSFIDFLRDIGKCFRVNSMLGKQSVRQRLQSSEGISYTEFTYQILQAFDFFHLNKELGVNLQIGGSDQWGNITAGCDLIRKLSGKEVHGLTFPLLLRSDGKKFGKSERGAIWISDQKLSPFDFYQYLLSTPDADVAKIMQRLTVLDLSEIEILKSHMDRPERARQAQRLLAAELTRDIHGEEGLQSALRGTEALKMDRFKGCKDIQLLNAQNDLPNLELEWNQVIGIKLVELLFISQMTASRADARRLILNGGIYLNGEKIKDTHRLVQEIDARKDQLIELGVGRKKRLIIFLKKSSSGSILHQSN